MFGKSINAYKALIVSVMKKIILFVLLTVCILQANAVIKLPAIFSDNMMFQQNSDVKVWGWGDKNKAVTIAPSWTTQIYTTQVGEDGVWSLKIPTPVAGNQTYSMKVSGQGKDIIFNNILIGEVWLCLGQSNMEMPMKGFKGQPVKNSNADILRSTNKNIRLFTVKRTSLLNRTDNVIGTWTEASPESVSEFSATGYYFGRLLNEMLDVPVGLILSSWGGTWIESWMAKEWLTDFPEINIPKIESDITVPNRTPTTLYNGMINPIKGYTIKGSIMYQGESNYDRPKQYVLLFEKFVKELRVSWGQGDFPFYFCQIAPYDNPPESHGDFNAAYLREAQLKASYDIPNSGMVVLMDIGEEHNIHPQDKQTGGERLSLMALGKAYRKTGFAFESPSFESMEIKGSVAILSFANAPMWMTSYGKEMKNFEIAGADHKFYPAKAKFNRSKVEVSSDKVSQPVAVRYGFKDYVNADLFGTEGLPVSSFRTDNWDE